ncbi:aminopeptidase [Oricola sp.]|uniref:aminopeptidase n=1 Tax=Oricola sp. TaxID=1979950 RepID=UPI0025FA65E9|nr:aminopeptidase [Oricola sp.]MCI5075736.1 aminopeptidase [Oricola sp.]
MSRALSRLTAAAILLPVLLAGLAGCTGISYYAQSLDGHLDLLASRKSVEKLIDDPSQPSDLRAQMAAASEIRQYATDALGLPDNASYRSYVDTKRDYVTIAVFAAPEFSLQPLTWCFPVYGCVPYRGYFSKEAAISFATESREQGLDVYVSGITAYSTLGWFADPLLNTMFDRDEASLAGLVFHELAHQRVYVRDDTAFNEGFAVAVETTGVRKWLAETADAAAIRRYEAGRAREADFVTLLDEARKELWAVYSGPGTEAQKRADKAAAIERLRARYRRMRDGRWGGYRGFDAWFDTPINNAKLAASGVYNDLVPDFLRLFEACSGDYEAFYAAVARLGAVAANRRHDALRAADSCG